MIFRIYEDGMGGYFGYWTTPGMDAVSGILAGPMLVLAILIGPLFCVMMFGASASDCYHTPWTLNVVYSGK